ncbi:queuosine precursor transporter [Candidatus Protochlamydia amoebophila]|uniref:Probable queuosine precursor transporter n=2 Tax=Candidatus Protochlamydia amoebophila TaxID=362787 RepID=Q6MCV8_PARUW|nr:queuosine precursor transporter [Candidatus Protochlamydia amoebophila]CAF23591.1 unnamed protein product [Candidatus Protochlamydia amoebophila UWE25]
MRYQSPLTSFDYYSPICAVFCLVTVLSNILSAKMVFLPLFQLNIPAGLLTYPLTFLLSDLITELLGAKKAKEMIYTGLGINILSFGLIEVVLLLPTSIGNDQGAFKEILGLSGLRIFSSLTAYLIAQIIGIQVYALIKKFTGSRFLWLRSNGAACISQLLDSIVIDMLYFYWGLGMPISYILPIIFFSFAYKTFFNFSTTPVFYFIVYLFKTVWQGENLKRNKKEYLIKDTS